MSDYSYGLFSIIDICKVDGKEPIDYLISEYLIDLLLYGILCLL